MGKAKLMQVSYYDPDAEVRLTNYADTLIIDAKANALAAIRFGGYPEQVKAMSDAIYGGCGFDVENNGVIKRVQSLTKQYRRQITHDGIYAEATLLVNDDQDDAADVADADQEKISSPKKTYIFCEQDNPKALFEELDKKVSVPLIPQFQDYFLSELQKRNILKPLTVISLRERFDAWVLESTQDDKPLLNVIDDGLKSGAISIPTGEPLEAMSRAAPDEKVFDEVSTVSQYLKTFGVTVAERIKKLFKPLFDPATEHLSREVLAVNEYMCSKTKYSLYDAQLAVAESLKRQLDCHNVALAVAECGSGKSKIGSTALYAHQQSKNPGSKTFNIVLCPSQITEKWVRELEETLPNTFAGIVTNTSELDTFYAAYKRDNKTAFAVISKEMARDGYMKRSAAVWNKRTRSFICPDCGKTVMMDLMEDGSKYRVKADQFFFKRETDKNHKCDECGSLLWTALNPNRQSEWVKIGGYGFVYRSMAYKHLKGCKNPGILEQLEKIVDNPHGYYPAAGAYRRIPLSTYIKHRLKGRLDGLILDELHQYSGQSGQGDADTYELTLTSTNYEAVIQCKLQAAVESGGSMVIDAKLFSQILSLLSEQDVQMELNLNMSCGIRSGAASYTLGVQPGKNYPKPDIPFPENGVKVSNIAGAAKNTVFAAAKTEDKLVMTAIRVEIGSEKLRACGCDGKRLMERHQKTEAAGSLSFLIPAHSFNLLSGLVKDEDTLAVGIVGNCAVFTKENFLFSARLVQGVYIDVDKMMSAITPDYSAVADTKTLVSTLDAFRSIAKAGDSVNMAFGNGNIHFSYEGDNGQSNSSVEAEVKASTSDSFRYNLDYLYEALRRLSGKAEIQLSSVGMLLIRTETETYFQVPLLHERKTAKSKKKAA